MSLPQDVFSQSSLVPIAKIASASTRLQRITWVIISTAMFIGLCSCIALVIIQYCMHQTVFQLDYSGRLTVYDQIPGITICPEAEEIKRILNHATRERGWTQINEKGKQIKTPWLLPHINKELLKMIQSTEGLDPPGAIAHFLPVGNLYWDTHKVAKSPIYRALHNYTVTFRIKPANIANNYRLFVLEQVPNIRHFMCTTFELTTGHPDLRWSQVEIIIQQDLRTGAIATGTTDSANPLGATFSLITHERGEIPFSAYDRTITTPLPPQTEIAVYFSKYVTKRANTARSPCHDGADAAWLTETLVETDNGTFLDFIDHRRLFIKKKPAWPTNNVPYLSDHEAADMRTDDQRQPASQKNAKSISLFNTEFLYSREACGWKVCCMKMAMECECTCSMDWLLSTGTDKCPNDTCERVYCSDSPVYYGQCPMPCIISKFIKQNSLTIGPPDSNLLANTSNFKLFRSENVQVAAEEEIYSLAKLFSEIGGLCSLFIGFSCIFIFEFLEAMLMIRRGNKTEEHKRKRKEVMEDKISDYCCAEEAKKIGKDLEVESYSNVTLGNHHQDKIPPLPPSSPSTEASVILPVILRSGLITNNQGNGVEKLTPAEISSMRDDAYLLADSQG